MCLPVKFNRVGCCLRPTRPLVVFTSTEKTSLSPPVAYDIRFRPLDAAAIEHGFHGRHGPSQSHRQAHPGASRLVRDTSTSVSRNLRPSLPDWMLTVERVCGRANAGKTTV